MLGLATGKKWIKKYPALRQVIGKLIAKVPPSVRLGKKFWSWYAFFKESETWTVEQMRSYQLELLRELLGRLKATSPFYQKRLAHFDPEQLESIEQFSNLVPALRRDEYATNYDAIRSTACDSQKLALVKTSGTTGLALSFYHTAADNERELAAIFHQWNRVGFEPGKSLRAEFLSRVEGDRLIDVMPEHNKIRCSILNLKEEHVRLYADALRTHNIEFIVGYPSALHLLSSVIQSKGINFPQPRGIFLASEQVYDSQFETIRKTFPNSKFIAHYGCAERTVLAGWCEHRREYHVLPHYALVETDSDTGEVIGTNLHNTVNGFVRYRMTDTVLERSDQPCPDCGRPYIPRLVRLGGRIEDYLYSVDKGWIPPAIVTYPLKHLKNIEEIRFVQKERDRIVMQYTIRFGADEKSLPSELETIESGLVELFGPSTCWAFERQDEFARDQSGKFKWIVTELDEGREISGDDYVQ